MTTSVALRCPRGEKQHLRERKRVRVGDGQERGCRTDLREPARAPSVKLQLRGTAVPHDLDITPQDAARVPGAKRLHRGFLCREASGKMNRGHAAPCAVRNFAVREHTPEEPIAVPLDGSGDAADISGVQAESDDVRHAMSPA